MGKKITYVCDHCGVEFDPSGPLATTWIFSFTHWQNGQADVEFARGWTATARDLWKDVESADLTGKVEISCGADCATAVFDRWIEESGTKADA